MSVCGTVYGALCLEIFLESVLCVIYPGEPEHLHIAWSVIKHRLPDFPGNHPYDTNANPIMRYTYYPSSSRRTHNTSWNINHVSIEYGFRHSLRPD